MKKIIPFVFAAALFSCKEDASKKIQTIISGTISNNPDGKIKITGHSFERIVTLNPDGTFTDTLELPYSGVYQIADAEPVLYLEPNQTLNFVYDMEQPDVVTFNGDMAVENNYIQEKTKLQNAIIGNDILAFFALKEPEYIAKVEELNARKLELLNATQFKAENFKALEAQNLNYEKSIFYVNYPLYFAYATEQPAYIPSESFPKIDSNFNFNNEIDFNFSPSYQQLLLTNAQKRIKEQTSDNTSADDAYIVMLQSINNPKIKDYIIGNLDVYFSPNSNDLDKLYKALLAQATDEKLKTSLTEKYNKYKPLSKGSPSPNFEFENHKGGKTSLADLKGKYVYIDVWATWCGPCIKEIPSLKKVEEQYKNANITFVGISIDEKKNYDKWKTFVTARQLVGVQLIADNAWNTKFVEDYDITGIPRFILLDPNGNIVSADAPRPSQAGLIKLFDELKIK